MDEHESRFEAVTRRAFLRRSLIAGAGAAGALGLAACGRRSDASAFADVQPLGTTTTRGGSTSTVPGASPPSTTTPAGSTATTRSPGTAAASGPALADGAELRVAFTFTAGASSRGPAKNPYIAVWVEDAGEDMVATISLWLMQGKGERWWRDLTRWYEEDAKRMAFGGVDTADTITGATRTPGDYEVVWDGTGYDGAKVGQGAYWLCIEAAREHGPYELIREQITLGDEGFTTSLTPRGELTAAEVTFRV